MSQATALLRNVNSEELRPRPGGRFSDLHADKLRGGYYTSPELAAWLCAWAIRSKADTVLEPSCGDGVFLEAAAQRLADLGGRPTAVAGCLTGIEIAEAEADRARRRLSFKLGLLSAEAILVTDFFAWWRLAKTDPSCRSRFQVVVGNPPFIRYQSFPEPHRSLAMSIMTDLGLVPNRLTNIWVPFVAAAAASLTEGGRMALVLPAELLQVSYASQLRSFLTDRFSRVDIVACNQLFFEQAEQEVVLLLADGNRATPSATNTCRVTLIETPTVADITKRTPRAVLAGAEPKSIRHDSEKWLKYFLTPTEIAFMRELRSSDSAASLSAHAEIDVGVVTGKNEFFVLDREQVAAVGASDHVVSLISRSAHLRGAKIRPSDLAALSQAGDRVYLLSLGGTDRKQIGTALRRYIQEGEAKGFHEGYKCSIREPWYAVPTVWVPDGFAFRQIYDFPRIVMNQAGATSTDTIHRLRCKANTERVIANTYTHMTGASAEIEGRSYGGGVLELEPTEAERVLVPAKLAGALALGECDRLVRLGRIQDVLLENDKRVLIEQVGLSKRDCARLRQIWTKMRDRRLARRRRRIAPPDNATKA